MASSFFNKKSQITDLWVVLEAYLSNEEVSLIKKAYKLAEKAHSGQLRRSGESYIYHPLAVALILAELKLDYYCIVAAILHDCIEDTSITKDDVEKEFGSQVAHIVEGVSKLTHLEFNSSSQKQAKNFQKLVFAMSKDMRVMIIKLADRLHNMRTIDSMSDEKKIQKAKETSEIHAPIARRLGLHSIRVELDDLCFKTLHPRKHLIIKKKISKQYGNQKKTINLIKTEIEKITNQNFTTVLANLYRNEKDSNGWHADNEKELGRDPIIASISLGETRKFQIKNNTNKESKCNLELTHGSLLLMKEGSQIHYKHQLPKSTSPKNARINLTFRTIL